MAFDISSGFAVLALMGPKSRALLASLTDTDVSNESFPFGTSRVIDIGYARVRASRISYVGELGWELYIPSEFAQSVFDEVMARGRGADLRAVGFHAVNSLRMEKAYRHWGHDIGDEDTPLEAGLGFAVAWSKPGGFIGRDALLRQREAGVRRRLAQFKLHSSRYLLYHNEPIWRDGRIVGRITSGMYGHTVGGPLGMGYLHNEAGPATAEWVAAGRYEIEVAAERIAAEVSLQAFHDPAGTNVRA
jgi:4-methylaminobutanoate oxidase (formaldehyde-forming)